MNEWRHVCLNYNGTRRLYINGKQEGSSVTSSIYTSATTNCLSAGAVIGRCGIDTPTAFSNCQLDDIQIYNRALSQNEITQLYQLGRGGSYAIDYEMMMEEAAAASRLLYLRRCGAAA